MPRKISICTLGCRVNAYESLAMADSARSLGLEVVEWGRRADFAVVNSCALTVLAQAKSRREVRVFARANPGSPIAVTGCYAQTSPGEAAKLPNVRVVAGNSRKAEVVEMLLSADFAKVCGAPAEMPPLSLSGEGPIDERVSLKIQDGCDNCCSYCIIPRARGRPRSRGFAEIMADARRLVSRGAREITLTGINLTKFSSPEGGIVGLVDALDALPGLLRVRLGSVEPHGLPAEALLERAADPSHKLQPHFHVSAQSLCDRVLSAMRRKNSASDFLGFVARARAACSDISIGADIICAHPFERDCDYLETKSAMLSSGLSYAHVFAFSPRPGTPAFAMAAETPDPRARRERSDDLRAAAAGMHRAFMASQIGKIRPVLLENMLPDGRYAARTDNYIQVRVSGIGGGLKNTPALARLDAVEDSERMSASAVRA